MRFRIRIRHKIVLSVLAAVGVTLLLVVWLLFLEVRNEYERTSLDLQASKVEGYAQRISLPLNLALSSLRALADDLNGLTPDNALMRLNAFDEQAARLQNASPQFSAVWGRVDYRYLNPDYRHFNGSEMVGYYGVGDAAQRIDELRDTAGLDLDDAYIAARDRQEIYTHGPSLSALDSMGSTAYTFTLGIPFCDQSKIPAGVVGAEVRADFYETLMSTLRPVEGTYCVLLSASMQIVAGLGMESCGHYATDAFAAIPHIGDYCEAMMRGEGVQQSYRNSVTGEEGFFLSAPIWVGASSSPWAVCLIAPKTVAMQSPAATARSIFLVSMLGLLAILGLLLLLTRSLGVPIQRTSRSITALARGSIHPSLRLEVHTGDEIERIAEATNRLLTGLEEKARFAVATGQGQLDASLHASEEDVLGQSLLEMQRSLARAKEREDRQRSIEEQQAWAARGVAKMAELLRREATSVEDFAYSIVRELVSYTHMLVGAVYLKEENEAGEPVLRMVAMHAHEVRKFAQATFALGEGLVGRCAKEENRLLITDIPPSYLRINSGLGGAAPDTLLLVPVLMNGVLQGVLEFACFGEIPEYRIKLIESVASSFASTLVTVQNSIRTKTLLQEAQRQSEEMSAQEEAMRQNMEELRAIQEESSRQTAELESLNRAMQSACYVVEYDLEGRITNVNDEYLTLLRLPRERVIRAHHSDGLHLTERQQREYQQFWMELEHGTLKRHIRSQLEIGGRLHTFIETYAPIIDNQGSVVRVLKIAFDITDFVAPAPLLPESQVDTEAPNV